MNDRPNNPTAPTPRDASAAHPGEAVRLPAPCAAFRGQLSAYLDGGMADAERTIADTHVAACPTCRHLADEVEAAERLMAHGLGEDAARPLPPGFTGAILARTVHETPIAGRLPRTPAAGAGGLVPWLGWVAAAALVVFNLAVWNVDGRPAAPPRDFAAADRPPATVPASWQVSATLDGPDAGSVDVADHDDYAALHAAATLLDAFAGVDRADDATEAAAFAARVIEYDELLPRLALIARDLPAEPAATVELTRGLLEDLASGDPRAHARLRQRLVAGELTAALRRLEIRLGGSA